MVTPRLKMTFDAGWGESYTLCLDLDEETARKFDTLKPPGPFDGIGKDAFMVVAEKMKVRKYRKDLFVSAARRLGAQLAERMEDAEGWHDLSRVEPARESLGLKRER